MRYHASTTGDCGAMLGPLSAAIAAACMLLAGCVAPPSQVAKREPFVEKPQVSPPAARCQAEAASMFMNRESSAAWADLIKQASPELQQVYGKEMPMPGTAWYEYVRTGVDQSSQVDHVMADEYAKFQAQAEVSDASAALRRLLAGSMAFELGAYDEARRHFRKAVFWMEEATDKDLELLAVFGRSDAKLYKGDAMERAMVHFYLGLIAIRLNDADEARREFGRAILADQSKPAEEARGKFALLHYFASKGYANTGDADNAALALRKAAQSGDAPQIQRFCNQGIVSGGKLSVLIQAGSGPTKILTGADWHQAEYKEPEITEKACEVFVDGKHVGTAEQVADLWQQACSQGVSEEQKIQASKGGVKGLAQNVPYVNLLAVGWDVRGDIRSWALLPGRFLRWTGPVGPGEHTVTVKFYDESNRELVRYRQTWHLVPVAGDKESLLIVRSAKDKCNLSRKASP